MKLKDLSWVFLLSTLGLVYCLLSIISKVLFEWGGLAIIVGILLVTFLLNTVIAFI